MNQYLSTLTGNDLGLCDGGELEVQMFGLAQCLLEFRMFNSAQKPHYCKTPVSGSLFYLPINT